MTLVHYSTVIFSE